MNKVDMQSLLMKHDTAIQRLRCRPHSWSNSGRWSARSPWWRWERG